MKATLEFNLPEDEYEYKLASQGAEMRHTLWEMDQWLRSNIKYAPDTINEHTYKTYKECREQLRNLLNENNINLE